MNAEREARSLRRDNDGLNVGTVIQFAWSPAHNTVGCRWESCFPFLVFNTNYPMFGRSSEITDWVALEPCTEKKR